ncbi:MAG: methyltransferase domain-containing protein [Acidimicrobiales bacterium]
MRSRHRLAAGAPDRRRGDRCRSGTDHAACGAARWRSDDEVTWASGTAESLPVDDGWATVVWSLSTVHHWADVDAGLDEARRVLAPDGRLVVLEHRIRDHAATGHAGHGWTAEQADAFGALCRRHGFADVAVDDHPGGRGTTLSVVARRAA